LAKGTGDFFFKTIIYQNNSIPVHLVEELKSATCAAVGLLTRLTQVG